MTGRELNRRWGVGAQHALYSRYGTWYHNLERFPGALFDEHGYVLFKTKQDYRNCRQLHITKDLNVPDGIAKIHGYKKMQD
jgi:hypothetical protein